MQNELNSFVAAVDKLREAYRVENKYTFVDSFGARLGEGGEKFLRVMSTETKDGKEVRASIYCFIALVDSESKALGKVKKGDVLKPASWKTPAKHARGNIFDAHNGLAACNSYGPAYLRR